MSEEITFRYAYGRTRLKHAWVYLNGKLVGKIVCERKSSLDGEDITVNGARGETYQYFPRTSAGKYSDGGKVFRTFGDCKRSLESE